MYTDEKRTLIKREWVPQIVEWINTDDWLGAHMQSGECRINGRWLPALEVAADEDSATFVLGHDDVVLMVCPGSSAALLAAEWCRAIDAVVRGESNE